MSKTFIFVPGFLGSELHLGGNSLGELNKFWVGIPTFFGGGYRVLDLEGQFPIPGNLPIVLGDTIEPVYGDFYAWLRQRCDRLVVVSWDWRRSLVDSVAAVGNVLREEMATADQVVILGHSAGGKLAGLACEGLTPAQKVKLAYLVTIGTPWRGSWRAIEALLGWAESVKIGAGLAATGQFSIPRLEQFKIQKVLSTFPGLYELFPNDALQSQLSPPGAPNVWDPAAISNLFTPVNPAKLAAARTFANAHTAPDPTLQHINIVGVGSACPGPFTPADTFDDSNLNYSLDGDSVVPVQSARLVNPLRAITLEVVGEHGRLCSASGTLACLAALI